MKFAPIITLLFLAACNGGEETLVKSFLEKDLLQNAPHLKIVKIELGDKLLSTAEQKQGLALLGLKDSESYPLTVTFETNAECVAVAEAVQNDVIFNEKKVGCRLLGSDRNLKYVKQYNHGAFGRQIAVYEEGKVIKPGTTFTASGEWLHLISMKDEKKSATLFKTIK